ncbi:hypothetical protein GDO81_029857 [Engystomops pustulosus]|uniref:Suppressor of forked domain-containing protein n=1 Tax=Engystomops pustulosus TaxID=76066 RepID=A0AAV6YUL2_ENGPU|nr:hypothetical protein GDO81_029857 [Engystomops pustulosus]
MPYTDITKSIELFQSNNDGRYIEDPIIQAAEYVPEKVKKAEKKLEDNPYDLDAWSILIREAQNQPIDKARKTYERLVAQFPSSGRFWKLYIEAEVNILFFLHFLMGISKHNSDSLQGWDYF